jgi:hypothetical protein
MPSIWIFREFCHWICTLFWPPPNNLFSHATCLLSESWIDWRIGFVHFWIGCPLVGSCIRLAYPLLELWGSFRSCC